MFFVYIFLPFVCDLIIEFIEKILPLYICSLAKVEDEKED